MSSICGDRKGGVNPRLHSVLMVLAVLLLLAVALSFGVVAVVVIAGQGDVPVKSTVAYSTLARVSTTRHSTTTTTLAEAIRPTSVVTTLSDGPPTTFIEYITTTTLPEAVGSDDQCNGSHSYSGPSGCRAKNSAWFDRWIQ